MICTFFGNRDTPSEVEPVLYKAICQLIVERGVTTFYVGNHGRFDRMVYRCLKKIKKEFSHICYYVVLAYLPKAMGRKYYDANETIYPEGLERVPHRLAIIKRNEWMLERSDFVVTYVAHTQGGAGTFQELAEKKGKTVLKLTEMIKQER